LHSTDFSLLRQHSAKATGEILQGRAAAADEIPAGRATAIPQGRAAAGEIPAGVSAETEIPQGRAVVGHPQAEPASAHLLVKTLLRVKLGLDREIPRGRATVMARLPVTIRVLRVKPRVRVDSEGLVSRLRSLPSLLQGGATGWLAARLLPRVKTL